MQFQKISIPPPPFSRRAAEGRGLQKEAIPEGLGGCLKRFFFSGDLSEIVELLINNSSSVEQAFSYLVLPVFKISIDRFHCPATKKNWKPSSGRSQENELL